MELDHCFCSTQPGALWLVLVLGYTTWGQADANKCPKSCGQNCEECLQHGCPYPGEAVYLPHLLFQKALLKLLLWQDPGSLVTGGCLLVLASQSVLCSSHVSHPGWKPMTLFLPFPLFHCERGSLLNLLSHSSLSTTTNITLRVKS